MKNCSTCNPPASHHARPMRKAYVPVPPARPVVSVSRKSHLAGFERAARILRERASSRVRESNSIATGEGSENSGVENQFRTAKCSPKRFFETPAPSRRPSASSSSGERGEAGKFIGGRSHLRTQAVENGKSGFFGARRKIARRAHTGRAALVALACGNELARFLHEEIVGAEKRLRKADAAGVGIEEIEIWLEEFLCVGGDGIFKASRGEFRSRVEMGHSSPPRRLGMKLGPSDGAAGIRRGRAFADG